MLPLPRCRDPTIRPERRTGEGGVGEGGGRGCVCGTAVREGERGEREESESEPVSLFGAG